jgi:hypothetical protein
MQAANRHLGAAPPAPGAPGPFARPTPEALQGLLEDSAFSDVEADEQEVTFEWRSPQAFSAFARETLPPVRAMTAGRSPDTLHEIWEAVAEAVRDANAPDGAVRLSNVALLALGRGRQTPTSVDVDRRSVRMRMMWAVGPRYPSIRLAFA